MTQRRQEPHRGQEGFETAAQAVAAMRSHTTHPIPLGLTNALERLFQCAPAPGRTVHRDALEHQDGELVVWENRSLTALLTHNAQGYHLQSARYRAHPHTRLPVHYLRLMSAALAAPLHPPERVLCLGLGAGTLPTYLCAHLRGLRVEALEHEARIIETVKRHFPLPREPEFTIHHDDAAAWLAARAQAPYPLILCDLYRHSDVPVALRNRHFYRRVAAVLAPGGALAVNLHRIAPWYRHAIDALHESFGALVALERPARHANVIAIACAHSGAPGLHRRARALQRHYRFAHPLGSLTRGARPLILES